MNVGSAARSYFARHGGLPAADERGHRTRYSDSSLYDEVCILCGGTDAMELQHEKKGTWGPCPNPLSDEQVKDLIKGFVIEGSGI